MTDLPIVSVVTPSLNQACFLRRAIDSVLGQTYPHIEYLVIDGGSTDGSMELLRSYGSRLTWISERDSCQAEAVNKGFDRSHGVIRAFLNSDDVLHRHAVQRVVELFKEHPDWDMLYGRAHYIDEHDHVLGFYPTKEFSFDELRRDCFICQPAAFWTTRIAERVGPFNESLKNAIDYHYWLRMARMNAKIVHVPDVLACSRLHKEMGTLTRRYEFYQDMLRACLEETGKIEEPHLHGLWHHLCHERTKGWAFNFRRLPRFYQRMAFLHYKWLANGQSISRFAKDAFRAVVRRALGAGLLALGAGLPTPPSSRPKASGSNGRPSVRQWAGSGDPRPARRPTSHFVDGSKCPIPLVNVSASTPSPCESAPPSADDSQRARR